MIVIRRNYMPPLSSGKRKLFIDPVRDVHESVLIIRSPLALTVVLAASAVAAALAIAAAIVLAAASVAALALVIVLSIRAITAALVIAAAIVLAAASVAALALITVLSVCALAAALVLAAAVILVLTVSIVAVLAIVIGAAMLTGGSALSKFLLFDNDFRGIDLDAVPVGIAAGLDPSGDSYLEALTVVLLNMLTGLAECHAAYEVSGLLICAVAAHSPVHCQGISGDAHGVLSLGVPDFGVSGKTSHEYYFVHFYFLSGALLHRGTAFFLNLQLLLLLIRYVNVCPEEK